MTAKKKGRSKAYVVGVSAHHSHPDHVEVRIAHGARRKKQPANGKHASPFPPGYDDRPTSNVVVHKNHAHDLGVGQQVRVSVKPVRKKKQTSSAADGDADDLYGGKAF